MKKVLMISNRVMHYRVSIYNYFTKEFRKSGWELFIRSDNLQPESPYSLNFNFEEMEFNFTKYKSEIKKINPDAVIIFLHIKDFIIWPLIHWLRLKKIPIAFWTKGLNLDNPNDRVSFTLYRYLHRFFDGLILYSENEKKYIKKKYHNKIFVANNTINFHDFPEISETKEEIKKEFNIRHDKIILSVGRMGAVGGRKKIEHLIKIFNRIDRDDIGLVIVGSGLDKSFIENKNNNITYLGEVHDERNVQISKIFKMADLFSIPGHVGLGLNQAMYWGLPVITEYGNQPPEIHYLKDGINGFIVPEDDITELENKILYLMDNEKIRAEFSKNAKEYIMQFASVDKMFEGFKQCIDFINSQ